MPLGIPSLVIGPRDGAQPPAGSPLVRYRGGRRTQSHARISRGSLHQREARTALARQGPPAEPWLRGREGCDRVQRAHIDPTRPRRHPPIGADRAPSPRRPSAAAGLARRNQRGPHVDYGSHRTRSAVLARAVCAPARLRLLVPPVLVQSSAVRRPLGSARCCGRCAW